MSDFNCNSEPIYCAAIDQDCTLGLVIQISNDSYDDDIEVLSPHSHDISYQIMINGKQLLNYIGSVISTSYDFFISSRTGGN